jgi:hypothetical protein
LATSYASTILTGDVDNHSFAGFCELLHGELQLPVALACQITKELASFAP